MKLNANLEKRATYEWCENKLVMKDVLDARLSNIENAISEIKKAILKIANNGK